MTQKPGSHIREVEEIKIEVPWGHIAAKWWGPQNVRPILVIHGWQDNAGSFDALIPLLPEHVSYLAIDLPGHGLSSRYPSGMIYTTTNYVYALMLIKEKFKWDKVSIMGHSMGSQITFLFAATFPDVVDMVIGLDILQAQVLLYHFFERFLKHGLADIMKADERNQDQSEPPSYSYDEAIDRLTSGTYLSVDRESAPYLLKRAIKLSDKYPDKYYFTRDSRLKVYGSSNIPHDVSLQFARKITNPYCFIKAAHAATNPEEIKYYQETLEVMKENPKFEPHVVDGAHHVHLTDPTKVSGIISTFINKYRPISVTSKL